MFKTGDLVRTNKNFYFCKEDFVCLILVPQWDHSDVIQVWNMKHKTIYYLKRRWCDLL